MRLSELVYYDETSPSCLRWLQSGGSRRVAGEVAGTFSKALGYWQVKIEGTRYYVHRVIALLQGWSIDGFQIDHIDRDRSNNKLSNLRVVTQVTNLLNKGVRRDSSSGVTGVTWNKRKALWHSRITVDKRTISLGYFEDLCKAIDARKLAEERYRHAVIHKY